MEPLPVRDLQDDPTTRLIGELTQIWSRSTVSTLIAVGEVIIRACYGGSLERWRERGTNARLRRLERHERLPFSRKTVHLALNFYELSQRTDCAGVVAELGVGHVRAVLGLPPADQERLLLSARREGWTTLELGAKAAEARRRTGRRSGRPPQPPQERAAREIKRHLEALDSLLKAECVTEVLPAGRLTRLASSLEELRLELSGWLDVPRLPRMAPPQVAPGQ